MAVLHDAVWHFYCGCHVWNVLQQERLAASQAGGKRRNSLQWKNSWPSPKGPGVENVMDIPFNSCKPWFELHVVGSTTAETTWTNEGRTSQEAMQVQQRPHLSWFWCSLTPHKTPPLVFWVIIVTDAARSHSPKELNEHIMDIYGHFTNILQWKACLMRMYCNRVGPEHDMNTGWKMYWLGLG